MWLLWMDLKTHWVCFHLANHLWSAHSKFMWWQGDLLWYSIFWTLLGEVLTAGAPFCSSYHLSKMVKSVTPKFPLMTRNKIDCFMMKTLFWRGFFRGSSELRNDLINNNLLLREFPWYSDFRPYQKSRERIERKTGSWQEFESQITTQRPS